MMALCLVALPLRAEFDLPTAPMLQRNVTPIASMFGVPRALGAKAQNELWFNGEISNNFTAASNLGRADNSAIFLDGESTIFSVGVQRQLPASNLWSDRWHWGAELPWLTHNGGFLDAPIDEFHDLFGLPDAGRPLAPRNRLDYLLLVDGDILARFTNNKSGLGDVRGWLGFQWLDTPTQQLNVRVQLKLPTGKISKLTGSDSTDVALWLEYARQHAIGQQLVGWHIQAGAGVMTGGALSAATEDFYQFGTLSAFWQWHPRWQAHVALAAQSELMDTGLKQAQGSALQLQAGVRVGFRQRWFFDFGFVEDVRTKSSADIVFTSTLRRNL